MDMPVFEMPDTEADVVFVGVNRVNGTVHVAPHWECDIPHNELFKQAAVYGLLWNESDGTGEVHVQIHDRRPETQIAPE